jgi:hypothetical protein
MPPNYIEGIARVIALDADPDSHMLWDRCGALVRLTDHHQSHFASCFLPLVCLASESRIHLMLPSAICTSNVTSIAQDYDNCVTDLLRVLRP